ncbi:MAG: flagellar basal body L-ring protein FlgH [Deltaproteobacteria bacterium]|nr:flagellar basal body L-ring protein FlgH [Deltaproteobacteria bacterium]
MVFINRNKIEKQKMLQVCTVLCCLLVTCFFMGCATHLETIKIEQPVIATSEVTPPAEPGSLWPGERANNILFADRRARYINDIITIVVDESSSGENKADTNTSRDSMATAGIAGITQASPEHRILSKYELGGSSENSLKGKGNTKREGVLQARITARVVTVLENGNLVIEGKRQLTVNDEDQFIIISGVVRPDDISSENIVSSQYIANARIAYTGKGVINDKMRPGWLTRIIDWVWPF